MAAPNLVWYEDDDTTLLTAATFAATGGTPTAAQEWHLWNDKGAALGSDTASGRRLKALVRDPGETNYLGSGRTFVDERWCEARVIGGVNVTFSAGSWTPLGANAFLVLPGLAADEAVKLEVRVNSSSDAADDTLEVVLTVEEADADALPVGATEHGGDGLLYGLGDGNMTAISKCSNVVQNPGGVDDKVQVQEIVGVMQGSPYSIVQQLVTLSQNDVAAAALAAGQAYYALLYVSTAGALTTLKGTKATTPLDSTDEPSLPAGAEPIALVRVDYDAGSGAIANADISQSYTVGFGATATSGLVLTLGPFSAIVDNALIAHTGNSTITLTDAATNTVWLQRDGSLAKTTDGTRPSGETRALHLYTAVTSGGAITTVTDRRRFIGYAPCDLSFTFTATLAGTQYAYMTGAPYTRPLYLLPHQPVIVWLRDFGSGMSAGAYLFDLEYSTNASTWTTLYTSSGTRDLRPSIAYNASLPYDNDSQPEVDEIPAYAQVRAKVVSIATGGTAPAGATVLVRCAVS